MTNHPNRNRDKGPWKMLTWANRDGTGDVTIRRYATRASAVRAADRLRAKQITAMVEHDQTQPPASHWRGA